LILQEWHDFTIAPAAGSGNTRSYGAAVPTAILYHKGGSVGESEDAMELGLLATLKDKLLHAEKFDTVFAYFLDHFGEDPLFIAMGEPAESPMLEAVIAQLGVQVLHYRDGVTNLFLTRLADRRFIHGGGRLGDYLLTVFYFEDIQMGLACAVAPGSEQTQYMRFSGQEIPRSMYRSDN
jgi:hypothetical protein